MPKQDKTEKNKSHSKQKKNYQDEDDQNQKRKKGAPKWKRTIAEIETLNKRINTETPPSGVLYYKYKASASTEEEEQKTTIANR